MSALVGKITAALDEASVDARRMTDDEDWADHAEDHSSTFAMVHCDRWSPSFALRQIQHARDALARHPHGKCKCRAGHRDHEIRPGFSVWVPDDCPEVKSLAAVWCPEDAS